MANVTSKDKVTSVHRSKGINFEHDYKGDETFFIGDDYKFNSRIEEHTDFNEKQKLAILKTLDER